MKRFSNDARMAARENSILANLQAVGNSGGLVIAENPIFENLQCRENSPTPTGGGNRAGGKKDRCATL